MRSNSFRFAPFSAVDLDELIQISGLPVAWPDFLFELHQELASRDFTAKEEVLARLKERHIAAFKQEFALKESAMCPSYAAKAHRNILDRSTFSAAWDGGRYVPLVQTIMTLLVHPILGKEVIDIDDALKRPNKKIVVDFARKVVNLIGSHERQLLGEQIWIFEHVRKIAAVVVKESTLSAPLSKLDPNTQPKRLASVAPFVPSTWREAANKVRHSNVHEKTREIARYRGDNNWADVSPLKMLGYSVDVKDGLNEHDRREFLIDFCEQMILPLGLPKDYVEPWGAPATKKRILRTAKHLTFVRRNFERQDQEKYARAIACW